MTLALHGDGEKAISVLGKLLTMSLTPVSILGIFFLVVFGAHLGLGEYWKCYWLIWNINNLVSILSKMLMVSIKLLDVNIIIRVTD